MKIAINALRVALRIVQGKIILNFGVQKRLRAFLYPIFTGGVVAMNCREYPLSLLTAFAASSPKGTPLDCAGNLAATAEAVPLGKVASP